MEIRLACAGDIPGMIDLLLQVGEVHHKIRPDLFRAGAQKYDEAALKELLKDANRPIFAAVEDGKLLGYCFCILETTKDNPVLMDQKSLYIDDLCVDENIRGKHVGSALYDYAVNYARKIGCDTVTLNVWCGNDSAMAFYESRGLKPRNIHMEAKL
ncbi:MAG: GNAT family N-acetyltransferase [Candidatus Faecousia sp.]|nr:GNAT family N-acetyltransferase [Candidatus Faecousia sp.]